MENGTTANKPFSEKPNLSVSLCGQLGVKKNFLQRAFGKDWNADKTKRYDSESETTLSKDTRPEHRCRETKENLDETSERSEAFIQSTTHQSSGTAKTSFGSLIYVDKDDCGAIPGQHRTSDTSKAIVNSPLVTKLEDTKMDEFPVSQLKMSSQRVPLSSRSNVPYTSREVLTPRKNPRSEIRIERTCYPITPLAKHLENGSCSDKKRVDSSITITSSGFSVKRRIFSHDDKENQPPLSAQDMISNQMDAEETKSSPKTKLNSLSPKAQTKQIKFPAVQKTDLDTTYSNSLPKQSFSVSVRQFTSQPLSSSQIMSAPVPVPLPCTSSFSRIRCPEIDKMKETKPDLGSSVSIKPTTGVARHLAIAHSSVGKGGGDCSLTPVYKQSVVTVKQTPSTIHLPISLVIQNNAPNTLATYVELQNDKPDIDIASSSENDNESRISCAHQEDKRLLTDGSKNLASSLGDSITITSSSDKDKVDHLHSANQDLGQSDSDPDPDPANQGHDSDNPPNQSDTMSHYPYANAFPSPRGNLPLEYIRQLQYSSHGAGTRMLPMTTATGVTPMHHSLGVLFNQGQVPMHTPTPSHTFLSPYIGHMVRPMYTSTPSSSSADSKEWQQTLRVPLPATSHNIRPLYASTPSSTPVDSKGWPQSLPPPLPATRPPLYASTLGSPSLDSRQWHQGLRLPLPATSQMNHQHQGLQLLAATGQGPHPVNFLTPSMLPYTVYPQGHRYLTQAPYATTTHPLGNEPTEQNLPLDLSGMGRKEDIAGSSRPNPCRKTLFPPNRPNEVTLPPPQLARVMAGDGGFNSSGDSAYKSDEDRRTPESQITSDQSSAGRDSGGLNGIKAEEKNPFGIHKILGVQKSPVKPKKIRNDEGYCESLMMPKAGAKSSAGAVRRPVKRRLSPCDDTDEDPQSSKKKCRDKPPLWGREMSDPPIHFEESEERKRFCDADLRYQVPEVSEDEEEQKELQNALLRLFEKSDLPPVPDQLKENLLGLRFFPRMSTLFQAQLFFDIRKLNIAPSGLAFENFRVEENNSRIDRMLRKEGDVYHCLGRKCIDPMDSVCTFTAKTLGKMRRHVKNHLPDKKWVCCFCRAQMTDQTDMSRHGTTHTMLRPFFCAPCGKQFTQKVTLVNHLKTNHSMTEEEEDTKERYTCRQCGVHYKASQRKECIEHLRKFHRKTVYVSLKKRNRFPFNAEEEA